MELRPFGWVRAAFWILAAAFTAVPLALIATLAVVTPAKVAGLVLGAGVLVALCVRAATTRVRLLDDRIVVRGLLSTREIPRTAVVGVTRRHWLEWAGEQGLQFTPLTVLWTFGPVPSVFQRHVNAAAHAIQEWVAAR